MTSVHLGPPRYRTVVTGRATTRFLIAGRGDAWAAANLRARGADGSVPS
jgi:hypothetical protein